MTQISLYCATNTETASDICTGFAPAGTTEWTTDKDIIHKTEEEIVVEFLFDELPEGLGEYVKTNDGKHPTYSIPRDFFVKDKGFFCFAEAEVAHYVV